MQSKNHLYDRFFKIISIVGFFFILLVLTILLQGEPAVSYEFSIYDAYPWYFWAFILSSMICGIAVIIGSEIIPSTKNYWIFGLCAILLSNILLLFIPVIRGYYIYGVGDVLTHIGNINDILRTASIGGNYYPIDHLLGVIIHVFSGLSVPDITLIIPPFFSVFFILSMYFVGKTIFQKKFELLVFVILSSILMWSNTHLAFVPNAQAFFLVPLVLYLAFKMYRGVNTKKYHILLLLIGFLIVFYHPLVTVMIILILSFLQILQYIMEKYENGNLKKVNYTYAIFFIVAVFSIWSTYLALATSILEPIIAQLLGQGKSISELQRNVDLLEQANPDPIYLLNLILNSYGRSILLGMLSFFSIIVILKFMKNQKRKPDLLNGIAIMGFIVIFILSFAMLVTNGAFGFGRIYSFANLFSLLLIPTGFYLFVFNDSYDKILTKKKIIKLFGVIFIICCITYFSLFNLYLSPTIKSFNQQVPRSDYIGMSTFFTYRDESLPVFEVGSNSYRFYDAIYGSSTPRLNIYFYTPNMIPPDHFGYHNETLLNNFTKNSKYLLVDDLGRGFYSHIYPEYKNNWRFLPEDFEQLNFDTKVQQVYSNKNFEVYVL